MKFFLDENFPKTAIPLLLSHGHEVIDIRGTADEGSDDYCVFDMAQERQAILLTTDRDFFHTIPHLFPRHQGIVVVTLRRPNRQAILARLSWFLNQLPLLDPKGKAYLLRDNFHTVFSLDAE